MTIMVCFCVLPYDTFKLNWMEIMQTSYEWCNGTPVNTTHLGLYNICTMLKQRRRRWADVVQMLYRCLVFAGTAYYK